MSQANYIIICEWRTRADTDDKETQIIAASSCAARLVSHIDVMHPGKLTKAHTQPISDLQHYLMDNKRKLTKAQVKAKVAEMFEMLDALEKEFEPGGHDY